MIIESPAGMEPMLPGAARFPQLSDLAVSLTEKAHGFRSLLPSPLQDSIAELVRSMNCYYSNLIEDHYTHPFDIERALQDEYSHEPKKRELQLEAKSHIEVQRLIDQKAMTDSPVSVSFIQWIHEQFCNRVPAELLWVENPETKEKLLVKPGKFREGGVKIGLHVPPLAQNLDCFLERFVEAYDLERLSKVERIIAVAASHHRLLWIHPFLDGNGRVARLFSHALLLKLGIGSTLWSVSRGLARRVKDYKRTLMDADETRTSDLDGRGSLSEKGLVHFCSFFLETCIDQIDFMREILEPKELLNRVSIYVEEEIGGNRLPKGSQALLRHAIMVGEFERGESKQITGYQERQSRHVLKSLLEKGLLQTDSPRGRRVRLGFPIGIVARWFPKLYPEL